MPSDPDKIVPAVVVGTTFRIAEQVAGWSIAVALLGAAFLLDPFAEAAFDAPKRFVVLLAAAVGGAALVWQCRGFDWRRWSTSARWIAAFAVAGVAGLVVATLASPHPEVAWPALRTLALVGLFIPLGASNIIGRPLRRRLLWTAGLATAVNALLSLLQAGGVKLPLNIARLGGRLPTGALLGNEGYVALACALMAAACLAFALNNAERRQRRLALGGVAVGVMTIAANEQITSAVALGAAALAIIAVRWNARWVIWLGTGLVLAGATAAVLPSVRGMTWSVLPVGGVEGYQRLTTYRIGAWAAAAEMALARPLAGYGPGTYAAQAQTQRLAAELRLRERLPPAANAAAFVHAHQDYLQLAAEAGIPTLLAFLAALGTMIVSLLRLAHSPGDPEPLALLGVLSAGAVAALAWFPMQIPFTAVVLLVACGRAWRVIAEQGGATG